MIAIIIGFSGTIKSQIIKGKTNNQKLKTGLQTKNTLPGTPLPNIRSADTTKITTAKDSLSRLNISVPDSAKGDLQTTVKYSARDSSIIDEENQTLYLFGNAKVIYGDIQLEAEFITLNWKMNEVFAVGTTDSTTKKKVGYPVFTQDGTSYDADTVRYNFKSRKGLIRGIVTAQNEGFV